MFQTAKQTGTWMQLRDGTWDISDDTCRPSTGDADRLNPHFLAVETRKSFTSLIWGHLAGAYIDTKTRINNMTQEFTGFLQLPCYPCDPIFLKWWNLLKSYFDPIWRRRVQLVQLVWASRGPGRATFSCRSRMSTLRHALKSCRT